MESQGIFKTRIDTISLSATDMATYIRLGRCDRFLAIRVRERSGVNVFAEYGVAPQPVAPLLKTVGEEFESTVMEHVARRYALRRCGEASQDGRPRGADNVHIVDVVRHLERGEVIVLAQSAVAARLVKLPLSIEVFGNIDLLRLARERDGKIRLLVVDVKRSSEARLDHHLQTALYAMVVEKVLVDAGLGADTEVRAGILRARREIEPADEAATLLFGCGDVAIYDATSDPEAYRWAAEDFVLSGGAVAQRAASSSIPDTFAVLGIHCDGCVNQEICHAITEANDDLCLIPGLSTHEKRILLGEGVRTLSQLVITSRQADSAVSNRNNNVAERLMSRLGARYQPLVRRARATARVRDARKPVEHGGRGAANGGNKDNGQNSGAVTS